MLVNSKVSIIIPNFNRAAYLKDALGSVMSQTYTNWECIVVDDGSTDASSEVVHVFAEQDKRITFCEKTDGSKGAAVARNKGVREAKGKYIIFLDSDDLLLPHCLQQRVDYMASSPDLDFAVFPMLFFFNMPGDSNLLWNKANNEDDLKRFLRLDAVWQTSGPIWRKEALFNLPLFDERLTCWQDVGFHINVLLLTRKYRKYYNLPPDCYYRKNSNESISQQSLVTSAHLVSRWILINDIQLKLERYKSKYSTKHLFLSFYFSYLKSIKMLSLKGETKNVMSYISWYKKKYEPNKSEYQTLLCLTMLKVSKVTLIPFINIYYNKKIKNFVPASSIGKFTNAI